MRLVRESCDGRPPKFRRVRQFRAGALDAFAQVVGTRLEKVNLRGGQTCRLQKNAKNKGSDAGPTCAERP